MLPLTCVYGKMSGSSMLISAGRPVAADLDDQRLEHLHRAAQERHHSRDGIAERAHAAVVVEEAPDLVAVDAIASLEKVPLVVCHWRRSRAGQPWVPRSAAQLQRPSPLAWRWAASDAKDAVALKAAGLAVCLGDICSGRKARDRERDRDGAIGIGLRSPNLRAVEQQS